jgi:predicted deacetylase
LIFFAAEFVPPFWPLSFQTSKAFPARDLRNRCFRWKSAEMRQEWLAAGAARLSIEIGPYGRYLPLGSRHTDHAYRPFDFYEGAIAEGAIECP